MWTSLRPWAMAVLWGYLLCTALVSSCLVLPLVVVPWLTWRLAERPRPERETFSRSLRTGAVVLPLVLVHACVSRLAWLVADACGLPPSGVVPFVVCVVTGPLALPWVGVLAYAGEPLTLAGPRAFDRWDERGLLAWLLHGWALGGLLGVPFLVFALGDGVLFLDEPLLALAGVLLVPASIGVGARHAVLETRRIPLRAASPVLATATVTSVGVLVPFVAGVAMWGQQPFIHVSSSWIDALVGFAPFVAVPLVGLGVAWSARKPNRDIRLVHATTRGALRVELERVVAEQGAEIVFDDGSVWLLEPGGSLAAHLEPCDRLPSGTRVDVCLADTPSEGVFRETQAREAFVELRPRDSRSRQVRVAQGGWLALAHGAMLLVSIPLWSTLEPYVVMDEHDQFGLVRAREDEPATAAHAP